MEPDLADIKARVKAWEKAFRAEHARNPTKEDIKADRGDIAEMYSLYRRLSKVSTKNGKAGRSSSVISSTPLAAEPTTPTPRRVRSSVSGVSAALASAAHSSSAAPSSSAGPSRQAPPITPQKQVRAVTPPRSRGYTGPVHDPNPNPFSVTPRKPRAATSSTSTTTSAIASSPFAKSPARPLLTAESPFIHASSPRRLREVLEANSLRSTRARESETFTPRTRARKRLAGEAVDDSPVQRKRRGARAATDKVDKMDEVSEGMDMDVDDDGLGETPVKPGADAFVLLAGSGGRSAAVANGRERKLEQTRSEPKRDLFPIFERAKRPEDGKPKRQSARPNARANASGSGASASGSVPTRAKESGEIRPPSPTDLVAASPPPEVAQADSDLADSPDPARSPSPSATRPRPPRRRTHVLALSEDEWDPEAARRTVRIVGTRRRAVRVRPEAGMASDGDADDNESDGRGSGTDAAGDSESDDDDEATNTQAAPRTDVRPNGTPHASPSAALSYLSLQPALRSPVARAGERLADLRVRALLDPTSAAAAALRAARRGQEVFGCGERGDEWADEEELGGLGAGEEGDDDWESDPEGWKGAQDEEW